MTKTAAIPVTEILASLGKSFAAHDAAGIAAHFAPDGVFINAVGPLKGDTYTGPEEVKGYFEKVFAEAPDAAWKPRSPALVIGDDQAVTQWHRSATGTDGKKSEWYGVDVYAFRDGKITKKDTYIKNVTA
ncbi:nuclear transport factor 2 family protein [Roseococcus pinisoli]|uniref:Nuclear transport factor 2 family protein n=1 Tax=Roseococcus pinisoli TaxID=2835040 RepID=A0ABS5QHW8_9PROT|nr:nuclear transport factor 2 family protein [Roseococcus pinisoli]MBS7813295.1 nuclear transport factor 2 family protein [Roseococcus pinisoli]